MTFKDKLLEDNVNEMETKIATLIYLSENMDTLNEADLQEGVNDFLGKIGMKLHKGDGLLNYIAQFSKGAGKIVLAAFKGDKEKVKEIASGMDRAKVMDFLLKLDMATMHIVTGPIHFIDAVTGWDLMVNLKHAAKKAESMVVIFKKAIAQVKKSVTDMFDGQKQQVMHKHIARLEKSVA